MSATSERARFLFREEGGTIDASTWRRHSAWLAASLVAMALVWWALSPYAKHDLKTTAFIAPMTIIAFTYLIVFAFAVLFLTIAYVMLSMKRLRDRSLPTGLAGLVPLLGLFAASAHFLQAQTPDVISIWYAVLLDVFLVAATMWTIVDLGFRSGRS